MHPALHSKVQEAVGRLRADGKDALADMLVAKLEATTSPQRKGEAQGPTSAGQPSPDVDALRMEMVALRVATENTVGSMQRTLEHHTAMLRRLYDDLGGPTVGPADKGK